MTHPPTPDEQGTYPPPPDPPIQAYQPPAQPQPPYGTTSQPPYGPTAQPPYGTTPQPPYGMTSQPLYGTTPRPPQGTTPHQSPYGSPPPTPYPLPPAFQEQPPPQPYAAYSPFHQPRATNGMAVASLVVSCLAVAGLCVWGFGGLFGVIGAVLGHLARKRIRVSGETGAGLALAGIIVGWIVAGLALILGVALAAVVATDPTI
ncbi:DUF4190 domain-containing protein [Symbioplanes lichenis]|uniref:DUF4190 domain-containing protein n=1 Tax=Symbioplanes lichenis TaxID=1629072 RepID=UPI0027395EE1|nr:DUF4190 domain-containing protein [Actinoplanes lichenis]